MRLQLTQRPPTAELNSRWWARLSAPSSLQILAVIHPPRCESLPLRNICLVISFAFWSIKMLHLSSWCQRSSLFAICFFLLAAKGKKYLPTVFISAHAYANLDLIRKSNLSHSGIPSAHLPCVTVSLVFAWRLNIKSYCLWLFTVYVSFKPYLLCLLPDLWCSFAFVCQREKIKSCLALRNVFLRLKKYCFSFVKKKKTHVIWLSQPIFHRL